MFILEKGHQPGVYVPLRAIFLVFEERNFVHLSGHIESIRNAPRGLM